MKVLSYGVTSRYLDTIGDLKETLDMTRKDGLPDIEK